MNLLARLQQQRPILRLVSLQFVSLAAVGIVVPYINLYLIDANFSATLIGGLSSIGAILALTITPMLNHFADRHMLHRRLFMLYMLLFALANIIFANITIPLLLILATLMFRVTIGPSITLGMQLTMTQIANRTDDILGQIRSFAALGFASASWLAGLLFAWGGYTLLFWCAAILGLLTMQVSTIFPTQSSDKEKNRPKISAKRHKGFYVLVVSQFFILMGFQNSFAFLFIHLTDNIGVATSSIGIWAAFLAGIEVPFFIATDKFLPRFPTRLAYILGAIGMSVFLFGLGMTENWLLVIFLFLIRGIMFPIFQLSSFRIVSEISHKQSVATNQAILHVTMPNLALLLSGSLFGWLFEHMGAFIFFAACAIMCLLGAIIVVIYQSALNERLSSLNTDKD